MDVAILFLQTINPDGRQALKSIRDVNGVPEILEEHFGPGLWDEKKALIEKWAGERRNVYVMVNEPVAGSVDMKEESVGFIRAVFSDTDTKAVQGRALDAMDDMFRASRPAIVTDSGGGIHTFWILAEPVAVDMVTKALAEEAGRGLQAWFDGDSVWNINRIMRVPGTVNYLNAKKRAAGRVIAPTAVLAASDERVSLFQMVKDYPAPLDTGAVKVSESAVAAAMIEIDMSAGVPSQALILQFGTLWTQGVLKGDATGSGLLFRLALRCREAGLSGKDFSSLALAWPLLGAKQREHRQLGRAWAKASAGAQAARVFDDGMDLPLDEAPVAGVPKGTLMASKVRGGAKTPLRAWLYARRLIRGYMSSTIAAGGTGKSSLTMVEAVAMASGKSLLGETVRAPLKVLIWNGEDPLEELERRLEAICMHYGVTDADLGDRLFMVSGHDYPLGIGGVGHKADLEWIRDQVETLGIDVVMIDPFVSSHRVSENDNMAIDAVAKVWSKIAKEFGCAIDLVHHIRKPSSGGGALDLSVDDARGASAMVNASRNARVLSPMPEGVALKLGVANRRAYFAIQHDATKANMVPGMVGTDWFHFASVDLGNGDPFPVDGLGPISGDNVGVVEKWSPTIAVSDGVENILKAQDEIVKGVYKQSALSEIWVGYPIAGALGLDLQKDVDKKLTKEIIKDWLAKGWLKITPKQDNSRHMTPFVEVGNRPEKEVF